MFRNVANLGHLGIELLQERSEDIAIGGIVGEVHQLVRVLVAVEQFPFWWCVIGASAELAEIARDACSSHMMNIMLGRMVVTRSSSFCYSLRAGLRTVREHHRMPEVSDSKGSLLVSAMDEASTASTNAMPSTPVACPGKSLSPVSAALSVPRDRSATSP